MTTQVCLIRHGETAWNSERRIQGHRDIPLNPVGEAQAAAAARWLAATEAPFAALYSSDLGRARRTAETLGQALGLTPTLTPAWRERRYGDFEGLTYDEAAARYPEAYAAMDARVPDFALPGGGESLEALQARIGATLVELVARHPGQRILVATHGGVLDAVNRHVRRLPLQPKRDFTIPNAGLNWVLVDSADSTDPNAWRLGAWADTRHLAPGALDELPG